MAGTTGAAAAGARQLTLALIKPDVAAHPHRVETILRIMRTNGFEVLQRKRLRVPRELAETFYGEHREKFFFPRLTNFITSNDLEALVLARPEAISVWRALLGPTKVHRTRITNPGTLRGLFGLSDTRNVGHGSDSPEAARREIGLFFPELDYDQLWEAAQKPAAPTSS
ncbi:uncharacterized protein MONBRDRAFT_15435 [Monosiga brevicollis MX1]|uniref:Nucleoside diphosphate kinase n=1 Tax=Monosiga brevicollis TaxID=81824 RepID=A9UUX3_MONBE|nr:uncharacterized protein MONBRDRAFT_15435 [Monosiga brevicollis MX1]EDQ90794.1 predicted protein [Monosiga brevicollis MX1]|eukprot:XP_001744091.1 hypothetical protein [Monosiga brevicollis MX1]